MIQRRYPQLPDPKHLTPAITKLDAEARDLFARARQARDQVDRLADPALDERARTSDVTARGTAVREGKPASAVGSPATEELAKLRVDAHAELEALLTAATQVEDDMRAAFEKLRATDHGVTAVKRASTAYRKAIDSLTAARLAYLEARSVVQFLAHAAGEQYELLAPDLRLPSRGVEIARIPSSGDRVNNLPPMESTRLLAHTFALDLEDDPTNRDAQ